MIRGFSRGQQRNRTKVWCTCRICFRIKLFVCLFDLMMMLLLMLTELLLPPSCLNSLFSTLLSVSFRSCLMISSKRPCYAASHYQISSQCVIRDRFRSWWNEMNGTSSNFCLSYILKDVFVTSLTFNMQKDVLKQVDWKGWLYTPGMPPVDVINW